MITYALRIWEVRYTGQVDVKSTVHLHWAEAAWAIASLVTRQLHPIVELVPCVDVLGRLVPLTGSISPSWSSSQRAWTVGVVDDDGGVRCEVPGWMQDGAT